MPPQPTPSGRPLVFAHRGGAALRPENTLSAFAHGLSLGADGLELDVHLSRDGEVVVHHDRTLERTTNGRGRLADFTAGELARLDAGYWFRPVPAPADGSGEFPYRGCGIGVPRLSEVLERHPAARLIIEMKVNDPRLAHRTIDALRAAGASDRAAVGSFYAGVLRAARAYEPRIPTGASREEVRWTLYRSWVGWPTRNPAFRELQVPETSGGTRIVSPRFLAYAHRAGLAVHVWTVNEPDDLRRLIAWGVDGLISDRPDLALEAVRRA